MFMSRILAFAAIPVVLLGILGSFSSCGDTGPREPTVSKYRDHAEWSRQMREMEMSR